MGDYSEALRGQNENCRSMSALVDYSAGAGPITAPAGESLRR